MIEKQNIKNLSFAELEEVLAGWQEKPFHAKQIFAWIYQRGISDFDKMSDLSVLLRQRLKEKFYISQLKLISEQVSRDKTRKYLFALEDKNLIESVAIPSLDRVTGCISSQAGCKFRCIFCSSGSSGFKRNLSVAEIIDQVLYLKNHLCEGQLTNLVFMGIGEPLDNYDNLLKAIRIINSANAVNIGARKITISTCGIVPGIERLAKEALQIELSISLHAADDKTRSLLMPVNKNFSLKDLMDTCRKYIEATNRQITFEYVLIKGINVSLGHARNLIKILKGMNCKVNLIPFNAKPGCGYEPPNKLEVLIFKDTLVKNGVNVTLRKSRGQDIEAACGQLRLRHENKN